MGSGIVKDEYLKEIDGVYIADNKVFESCVLSKTAGDTVQVKMVAEKKGGAERTLTLIAGGKGHSVQDVQMLRAEAEDETPWEDTNVFDRQKFQQLHPYLPMRKAPKAGTKTKYKTQTEDTRAPPSSRLLHGRKVG